MENDTMDSPNKPNPRRRFMQAGFAGIVVAGNLGSPAYAQGIIDKAESAIGMKPADVTPPEDLMREHGVLDRVLLIYEATMRKFSVKEDFDPKVIADSAKVVQDFIENYHEKSEEEFLFPRFRKAGKLVDLVDTLLAQHQAGRRVTATVLQYAPQSRKDDDARRRTVTAMQAFITMYRPHAAREDTVLFPALRGIVSAHEFDAMGDEMEEQEKKHVGEDGFERTAAHIAELEQQVGIADLRQFTPKDDAGMMGQGR
jgi:hemerythrin-like domain-containing protein